VVADRAVAGLDVRSLGGDGDLGAMRGVGVAAAPDGLVWLIDERGLPTASALERHRVHDRAAHPVVMGPCPLPSGHPDVRDDAWWSADRDLGLGETGVVLEARDCSFANASAPAALLQGHPFPTGYGPWGIGDVEAGLALLDDGVAIAFDGSAGIDALAPGRRDRRAEGADRGRFLARHPHRHRAVLRTAPGRVERALRRTIAARGGQLAVPVLGTGATTLRALTAVPGAGRIAPRLRELAALCDLYSGVARVAAGPGGSAVRQGVGESLAAATAPKGRTARWWRERVADPARMLVLPLRIHHVSGPRRVEHGRHELLAVTVVRNGTFYLRPFLEHHRRLGVSHFVVLDNGSTDGTVEHLRAQPDVTLLRTGVPYRTYENLLKRYLVRVHSKDRWNVFVDIDELFDYPDSDRLDVAGLLGYLDHHGCTAMVVQMLDMFPAGPLAATPTDAGDDLDAVFPYFDVSDISKRPYEFDTDPASTLRSHRGGIRRTVFGSENGLTKAALTLVDDEIETFVGWHHARRATFADVTGVLRHYPFNRDFHEKAEEAARTGRYGLGASHEYRAYWAVLADDAGLSLCRGPATRYDGVEQLVALDFLQVSDRYRRWVDEHGTPRRSPPPR